MTKLLLSLLLITQHNLTYCMQETRQLFEDISTQVDFSTLTATQKAIYNPIINNAMGIKPVECAALWDNISAMDWLLSHNINLENTKALEFALKKSPDKLIKAKITIDLLRHNISTAIVIDHKSPLHFMQNKLAQKKDYYGKTSSIVREMKHITSALKRHEDPLLWTWIKAAALIDSGRVEIIETTNATKKVKHL